MLLGLSDAGDGSSRYREVLKAERQTGHSAMYFLGMYMDLFLSVITSHGSVFVN